MTMMNCINNMGRPKHASRITEVIKKNLMENDIA